ncbi:unnamed protein product [Prunus armeniaca]|uniref:60S ribosome subunit biogenesis protein NIP7 homolog n=1 Tax=Prunus armeniaca TaxID=36596 RepID=A0A6J5WSS7_PRUAR|nr:unnamed protein product [Prunus armeniaca]
MSIDKVISKGLSVNKGGMRGEMVLVLHLQLSRPQKPPQQCSKSWTKMRPLDETETTAVFEKLFKFTGNNLKNIVENPSHEGPDPDSGRYCFRLHKNKVYYVSESLVKRATNIARTQLVSLGTCIGRFTHGGSFHLTVQCLSLVASNAKHKVWLKPTSEMSFLYGNHVLKGGLGRITENIVPGDGVVVFCQMFLWVSGLRPSLLRIVGSWIPMELWCFTRQILEST